MKKVYLLTILLLVLNSLAAAHLVAGFVTHRLSRFYPKAAASPVSSPAMSDELATFAPILDRGLFGKATRGALTPITSRSTTPAREPAAAQGDLVLVGTARGSFRETFALIRRTVPPEERVFRPGDQVFGTGRLVSVQKESVEILANGRRIRLLTPTATPAEPASASGNSVAPLMATGTGGAVIDQRQLNAALDNIGQAMTDARLLPSMKDGKVEGFRVSEVKPSGVFATVGIRNGDVLLRINELPIDSPERAIQTLASLKGQNRIRIDLLRDGQPTTFTYDVR